MAKKALTDPKQIKKAQRLLNKVMEGLRLKETGAIDKKTTDALARFKQDAFRPPPKDGILTKKTLDKLVEVAKNGDGYVLLTVGRDKYYITKKDYEQLVNDAFEACTAVVRNMKLAVQTARSHYDDYSKMFQTNPFVMSVCTSSHNATMPDEGIVSKAESDRKSVV